MQLHAQHLLPLLGCLCTVPPCCELVQAVGAPLEDREALFISCRSKLGDQVASEVQQIDIDLGLDPLKGLL